MASLIILGIILIALIVVSCLNEERKELLMTTDWVDWTLGEKDSFNKEVVMYARKIVGGDISYNDLDAEYNSKTGVTVFYLRGYSNG